MVQSKQSELLQAEKYNQEVRFFLQVTGILWLNFKQLLHCKEFN